MGKETESRSPQKEKNAQDNAFQGMIRVSKEEYEQLPPYMKTLASWEELQEAISKLNIYFCSDKAQGSGALNQDDVGETGLGRKGRSYLLILLRLNQLAMDQILMSALFATHLHSRTFVRLPKTLGVDFRVSCFCHKKTIDIGYVLFSLFVNILQVSQEVFNMWRQKKIYRVEYQDKIGGTVLVLMLGLEVDLVRAFVAWIFIAVVCEGFLPLSSLHRQMTIES